MNTTTTSTQSMSSSSHRDSCKQFARGLLLLAILLSAMVAAVYFVIVNHSALGLYSSIGVGAFTIDPLNRWLRDQS